MTDRVLLLGSGGREHALAWKLAQSSAVEQVFVAPGNAGTCAADKTSNVGIPCFGPSAKAAEIEASKHFAKEFMVRWNIPTARFKAFSDVSEAQNFINNAPFPALVVKASGLAAGKGVIVAADRAEACKAAQDIIQIFGAAGSSVIIEELLEGEEISCLAFTDGVSVRMLPPAQDYKRLSEGDTGPNTGGMGAYCPATVVSADQLAVIRTDIIQKAVDGLRAEGRTYQGVLYAGVMLTQEGPKVLEYNCRFGDPETQVLLPLLQSDLYTLIQACISRTLHNITPCFHDNKSAVAVVTVAKGYPNKYNKGMEIFGIDKVETTDRLVFHAGTKAQDGKILSNGGRVLAVVAMDTTLDGAVTQALEGADIIHYDEKVCRRDIARKAIIKLLTYSDSGVSISAGDALVDNIKTMVRGTLRPGCVSDLGMFGGAFDLKKAGFIDPLLVSGTDGVGTKLKIAQTADCHSTVGIDLVAMCVNDILCHGAEPLYFLDYFACGKLDVGVASDVVKGVAAGCQQARCALIGGETAEMPGMYDHGDYDLAGFAVGAVERTNYIPQVHLVQPGDHVIGLASTGIHSNGYSLVRRVVEVAGLGYGDKCPFDDSRSLGEALLTPTQIYVEPVLSLLKSTKVKAIAHITGGGLPGNICRVLPDGVSVTLDATQWTMPHVFRWITQVGNVEYMEMWRTFNCGIGLVLIADREEQPQIVCDKLSAAGCRAWCIGQTVQSQPGHEKVVVNNLDTVLKSPIAPQPSESNIAVNGVDALIGDTKETKKKRVGVLISGSGTNMQALIEHTRNPGNHSNAEIVLVISNKAGVKGLTLAQQAGIQTQVISHKEHASRELFDAAVHKILERHCVDIVCLAGFMRILTGGFVRKWTGRMLNIHPSLLPSFKGANAHELVLASRVRISGCTVHFVAEEVDAGAILVQESVPVYPDDTLDSLSARVKLQEYKAFPRALDLLASGRATLGDDGNIVWT